MAGSGMEPTTGEALVDLLAQHDVDTVFGIPGVHTIELYRGLPAAGIRHVSPRHEQGAAFMADAYARVTGRPGVCTLITGPGVTNAATPIAQAHHDSQPMLVLSSTTATPDLLRGHGPLHDLPDQRALTATITAFSETVLDPGRLPDVIGRAFDLFASERPRPVHVQVPRDVLGAPAGGRLERRPSLAARPGPAVADVARVADLLGAAGRVMIVLGGGAMDAGAEAIALAERAGAPIALSLNAKGAVPDAHPLCVGTGLQMRSVLAEIDAADVLLLVGTEIGEGDYYYGGTPQPRGAVVRIDIDPGQLGKRLAPAVGMVADAALALAALAAALPDDPARAARGRERTAALRAGFAWWPDAEVRRGGIEAFAASLPEDAIVAVDSTQLAYAAQNLVPASRPRSWLIPHGFGTLGPALPMAIGAKVAAPERPVIALAGDGGLLFTIAELASAADLGLALPIVLWNNSGYGEIADSMRAVDAPVIGCAVTATDYGLVARGLGCHAERTRDVDELPRLVREALGRDRPTLVEIVVA